MYERFQEILDERGMKPSDVAKATGVSTSTLSAWKLGRYSPKQEKLKLIADYLEVNLAWLMGLSDERAFSADDSEVRIPVLGQVRAGDCTTYAEEDVIDTVEISASKAKTGEFFGLKIKGDSMSPSLMDGDIVIVRKTPTADTGDIVIALVANQNGICKRLIRKQDGITLKSINTEYGDFTYSNDEIKTLPVAVIGKVEEMRRSF